MQDSLCKVQPYIEDGTEQKYYAPNWTYGDGYPWAPDDAQDTTPSAEHPLLNDMIINNNGYVEPFSGTDCVINYNVLFWIIIIILVVFLLHKQNIL